MGKNCLFCGDALESDAVFGRRNFCRYSSPNCNTEYNNFMRSIVKAKDHPNESIQKLARLLTDRELSPLKQIKNDWMQLTRKRQPATELITNFEKSIQLIYQVQLQ